MIEEILTLSVTEAAKKLGLGRNTGYKLVHEGIIPALRLGRQLRVPETALMQMLEGAGSGKSQEATQS